MLCQRCGKNPATVHLTDIVKNEKHEKHLCDQCAQNENITVKSHTPINEMLASFVMEQSRARELAELKCQECGNTFVEFRNNGLLGCPNDYDAFEEALLPLLERAHGEGATHHVGKAPGERTSEADQRRRELMRLRQQLSDAVEREEYEVAARLRDQIKTQESS
ncbi:MAG: UvrB/UvrC motif-containing protein [Phycisphaerae bacterium]|nr:UvrB/UvrC motif-containing protein [Phycisphaerae bacterium]